MRALRMLLVSFCWEEIVKIRANNKLKSVAEATLSTPAKLWKKATEAAYFFAEKGFGFSWLFALG